MSVIQGGDIYDSLRAGGIVRAPDARVFLVDPSDSGFTLSDAIGECIADQGDVIAVLPGSHSVASQVVFNKRGITVIGVGFGHPDPARGESFMVNPASGFADDYVAKFLDPCRVIGLGFAGRDTSKGNILIDSEGGGGFNGGFISFEHCRFPCWYGAMDALVRMQGGSLNSFEGCTFDGLFVGVGTAGIQVEASTGGVTADFLRVRNCEFSGMGSGKHAIVHKSGDDPPNDVLYEHNFLLPGFTNGEEGKFLDNNNVASSGLIIDNYVNAADKASAFENLSTSVIGFANNHYDE